MTYLNKQSIDYNEVKNFSLTLNLHPEIITGQLKELLITAAKDIAAGKNILFKRDPVVTKSSWRSAEIEVVDGNTARLSLLDTSPLGADFDGDTIALIPLLTKDAEEEAKMLNPKYNKNMYFNGESYNSTEYSIKLDGLSTLYAVTEV
jgi:DNA-directed RNA polymerase beta' subunit